MSCIAVKEAVWVLSSNKSGWVIYEKVLERGKLVRKELPITYGKEKNGL
ncbi:hypothetical protein HPL003_04285 [Paenibacillus terrae HPL-003]|uniref:Uncharacterized protein n=1 Tax=Paenibacillus terrae (strain HPL-003) TaxID=985665 RepID=G7VUM1_PAETH|nr:hypothetical protein HPL003_04285 [Paenibacillus terrae HPL-003]